MSLGETIYTLRTRRNLSQGDLAEQLDVSRQSISKWETDRSVPELDKLVKMSRLFGVSLDELVLGAEKGPAEERGENPTSQPLPPGGLRARKVISIVLFVLAALMVLLLTIIGNWSGLLIGLMFASPFSGLRHPMPGHPEAYRPVVRLDGLFFGGGIFPVCVGDFLDADPDDSVF